jgi:hypothetical protein
MRLLAISRAMISMFIVLLTCGDLPPVLPVRSRLIQPRFEMRRLVTMR